MFSCAEKDSRNSLLRAERRGIGLCELKLEGHTERTAAVLSYGLILLFLAFFSHLNIFSLALGFFPGDCPPGLDSVSWRSLLLIVGIAGIMNRR